LRFELLAARTSYPSSALHTTNVIIYFECVRLRVPLRLNRLQELLALSDRIVFSVQNLGCDSEAASSFSRGDGLFGLVIVVIDGE
jgi:hypothetical protein